MAEFLYQGLVDWFQDQVEKGLLSAGDKMPSLRKLAKEQGLSLNTVIHGYDLLVKEGWVEARTKSGYYVCHRSHLRAAVMAAAEQGKELNNSQKLSLTKQHRFARALQCNAFNLFGHELFSVQLNNMKTSHPQGELSVRTALTHFLADLAIQTKPEQIWLANRATSLLAQCIQVLTQPEAKILLITPCDYRLSQTILELGRVPVCLTAGDHGADIDSVETLLKNGDIDLLILPSQFAFPTGQELKNLNLRRWYALIETYSLTTIEWDMSSLLPARPHNTMTLKSLDQAGNVIYLGSVEGVHEAAPLAWLIVGRYENQLSAPLKALDLCPGIDQQLALLPLFNQMKHKNFPAIARAIWINAEKVKFELETLTKGQLAVVTNKGGHSLWVRSEKPISAAMWEAYEASHLNTLVPGNLLFTDSDAEYWFAFNISMTEQLNDTLQWLQQAWTQPDDIKESPAEDVKQQSSAEETVYNPMLDLINHDFG